MMVTASYFCSTPMPTWKTSITLVLLCIRNLYSNVNIFFIIFRFFQEANSSPKRKLYLGDIMKYPINSVWTLSLSRSLRKSSPCMYYWLPENVHSGAIADFGPSWVHSPASNGCGHYTRHIIVLHDTNAQRKI